MHKDHVTSDDQLSARSVVDSPTPMEDDTEAPDRASESPVQNKRKRDSAAVDGDASDKESLKAAIKRLQVENQSLKVENQSLKEAQDENRRRLEQMERKFETIVSPQTSAADSDTR